MPYPWPKHPTSPQQIWTVANQLQDSREPVSQVGDDLLGRVSDAEPDVTENLSGEIRANGTWVNGQAQKIAQGALVGAAGLRGFGDAVQTFNTEVDELNNHYETAKAADWDFGPLYPGGRAEIVANLDKRFAKLEAALDDDADLAAGVIKASDDPTEEQLKQWIADGALPPGPTSKAFTQYDFSELPQYQAWKNGYEFPDDGEDRQHWAAFWGPAAPGSHVATTQVAPPGPDKGIIYGRFFIEDPNTAWPATLFGDDRGFSTEPGEESRMTFAYNTATGEMTFGVSESTRTDGKSIDASPLITQEEAREIYTRPYHMSRDGGGGEALARVLEENGQSKTPIVETDDSGKIKVTFEGIQPQIPMGAVNTSVTIDPNANSATVEGDDYPSLELYRRLPDGSIEPIARDPEGDSGAYGALPPWEDEHQHFTDGVPTDETDAVENWDPKDTEWTRR